MFLIIWKNKGNHKKSFAQIRWLARVIRISGAAPPIPLTIQMTTPFQELIIRISNYHLFSFYLAISISLHLWILSVAFPISADGIPRDSLALLSCCVALVNFHLFWSEGSVHDFKGARQFWILKLYMYIPWIWRHSLRTISRPYYSCKYSNITVLILKWGRSLKL